MNPQLLKSQLQIAKNAIQSIEIMLEEAEMETQEELQANCKHPADNREKIPGMGSSDRWYCKACGYVCESPGGDAS